MKLLLRNSALLLLAVTLGFITSCKKDDDVKVQSGFTYQVDANDFLKVNFTSTAVDAKSLSWNFGDGSALSTEANPSHTFAAVGEYTVSLTATNGKKQDIVTQKITLVDPNQQLTALAGTGTKGWKLLRVTNGNTWPLEVGPFPKTGEVWWGLGRNNDDIANRPCTMNDEWIFSRDGKMTYDSHGDFWAEGGVFFEPNSCKASDASNLIGEDGTTDFSAFGDGTHDWSISGTQITVTGLGAFIGLQKIGSHSEVHEPQASVTLDILKLDDSGATDTLILESKYNNADPSASPTAYWKIVLVHYDDPNQEPPIPGPKPVAGFTFTADVLTITFTNTSTGADSYSWDFGDGATSTEASPVHTYASSGVYTVKLTATNVNGNATVQQDVIAAAPMTIDDLVGGAWKIRFAPTSIFVGPGLGSADWWQTPIEFLDGSTTGADDWSCILNDEFIFSANGNYEYKTNGDARNDGYFGSPNGCWSDAEVAASPGAPFGSGLHTFTFTPASASPSGRPIITLTNGGSGAAFIGFYKGYYGGENTTNANPPNGGNSTNKYEVMGYLNDGTTETLTVSVDISDVHDGSRAWSVVLVR